MPLSGPAQPRDLRTVRVLVVDDEAPMRDLLSRMLGRLKVADVVEAANATRALAEIAGGAFDLVLVDWNMPDMTGFEFFQRARAREPLLPFVMVTGRTDARSIAAARDSGVTAYVVKPVTERELKAKLHYVFRAGLR